jgi:dTDP-4-amino-4,6-dideoxygalactose transaminase
MDAIMGIARRHGLRVIEDAAQALGASYKGKKVCTFGDVGCISFFPSKNLGAFGDAGMVVTGDKELAARMRMIAAHGSRVRYYHEVLGINSRLDTIQAAILGVKCTYLDKWNAARRHAAARYTEMFEGSPVVPPFIAPDAGHIFHQYTLRVPRRDELAAYLKEKAIPHAVYYPVPLHLQKAFAMAGSARGDFPVTEKATEEVLSLPMHTELTEEQLTFITDTVKSFYARH